VKAIQLVPPWLLLALTVSVRAQSNFVSQFPDLNLFTLIEGTDGVLYGVAERNSDDQAGQAFLFKITKDGSGYAILASGLQNQIGALPGAIKLMEGHDGAMHNI
jgi:hypothetical protein